MSKNEPTKIEMDSKTINAIAAVCELSGLDMPEVLTTDIIEKSARRIKELLLKLKEQTEKQKDQLENDVTAIEDLKKKKEDFKQQVKELKEQVEALRAKNASDQRRFEKYMALAENCDDAQLKKVFTDLAAMERNHKFKMEEKFVDVAYPEIW